MAGKLHGFLDRDGRYFSRLAIPKEVTALQALLISEGSKLVHWEAVRQHVHRVDDDNDF